MNMTTLLGYVKYGLGFLMVGFIGIAVPLGYMIGEFLNHGGPYMISYSMLACLLLMGAFLLMLVYLGFDNWRDALSKEEASSDA